MEKKENPNSLQSENLDLKVIKEDIRQAEYYIDRLKSIDPLYQKRIRREKFINEICCSILSLLVILSFFVGFMCCQECFIN